MIPVSDLIRRASTLVEDEDHDRWTVHELVDWINEGAAATVRERPMAGARTETLALQAGASQATDAIQILDVVRNLPDGPAVQRTSRFQIDAVTPNWYAMEPATEIRHYMDDDRSPTQFYVYPPALEGAEVEVLVSRVPDKVADESGTLALAREYASAVLNYAAYRAFSKDSEYANANTAAAFYQAFKDAVGTANQAGAAVSANRSEP